MTLLTILLGFSVLVLVGALVFILTRPRNTSELLLTQNINDLRKNIESSSLLVHQQMGELTKELGERLQKNLEFVQESSRSVGQRLDNAARVVSEVQNKLGKVEEATGKVFEVGKSISSLQEILKAPKLRGALGELFLGDLLAQVLPKDCYELQYGFKSGEKVDAVIRSAHGLIAIDSKFPLENFRRVIEARTDEEKKGLRKIFLQDVKKHIDAISKKYILPDEDTLELALMYIPAENVYYEIILKGEDAEADLLRYAQEKKVFPVSPNSFYAYLQTISIGLRGMQMAEGIREVDNQLAGLKKDFSRFGESFALIGSHISNARGSFEKADKQFQRIEDKLPAIGLHPGTAPELRVLKTGDEL